MFRRTSSQYSWTAPSDVPAREEPHLPENTLRTHHDGRHEHGQNFLTATRIIRQVTQLVADTEGPILEIGPGAGALTQPMERLNRPLTTVEIHPGLAKALASRAGRRTDVVAADFIRHPMPQTPHVIVGNLPFHLTTAILRKLLHDPHWSEAELIVQWEVARRRRRHPASTPGRGSPGAVERADPRRPWKGRP